MERQKLTPSVTFFSSGSTLLDCALGGGWAGGGRIFNLVGDKSTGKTLLAVEAFANFNQTFVPNRGAILHPRMRYGEAESAFDDNFAKQIGFPAAVERPEEQLKTVEDFYADLLKFSSSAGPSLYILDSLDALSDADEMKREFNDTATYGVAKAKKMSELFRKLTKQLTVNNCTLGIISQVRENIGVMFGEHYTRSGGKALDFYCSQIVWLSEVEKLKREIKQVDRVTGVRIKAKVKKNKVGFPFREAEMNITFGYGVDDEISMLDWLSLIKAYGKDEVSSTTKDLKNLRSQGTDPFDLRHNLQKRTRIEWNMIEQALAPKTRKYDAGSTTKSSPSPQ